MITIEQAKLALGKTGQNMSDENIQKLMTIADYLTDNWLEEYEKTIFNGKTLNQLLQNG